MIIFGKILANTIYAEIHYKFIFKFLSTVKIYFLHLNVMAFNGWNQPINDSIPVNLHLADNEGRTINETKLDLISLLVDGEVFTFDTISHPDSSSIYVNVTLIPIPPARFMPTANSSFVLSTNEAILEAGT